MSANYMSVISCVHCREAILTQPDGVIMCGCTTKRSCKHPEGMGNCRDCIIDDLEGQLVDAKKEATCLSNYETAYNNLRLLTRSQYDDIDTLTDERNEAQRKLEIAQRGYDFNTQLAAEGNIVILRQKEELKEARGHWQRCEEGWNKVIKQAEDFQRERDEALADIDEMRAEGCAAAGVLENIFNGVTAEGVNHGDPTIAKTASVAAEALVNVPRCEHAAEVRWLKENLPAIIFGVVYYDLGEHGITWKVCVERWERYFKPALQEEHSGDCTDECHSCARCQAEDVMKLVDIVRKGLTDGE